MTEIRSCRLPFALLWILLLAPPAESQLFEIRTIISSENGVGFEAHTLKLRSVTLATEGELLNACKSGQKCGYRWELGAYAVMGVSRHLDVYAGWRAGGFRLGAPGYWTKRNNTPAAGLRWRGEDQSVRLLWKDDRSQYGEEMAGTYQLRYSRGWRRAVFEGSVDFVFWKQNGIDGRDTVFSLGVGYRWF